MKFEINSIKLFKIINQVGKARNKNTLNPLLNNLYLKVEDNTLIVRATNLEITCEKSVPIKGIINGECLINGDVFDSTEKTGKPATFKLSQVIPGWTEALQLMPAGSTWEVYIPSNLAYGERNVGGAIGPNETLVFNVHLLEVKKEEKKVK